MCWRVLSRGAFALLFVAACWLSAYAETGYRGAMTTYTGPTYEPSLMKDAASLALGPRARFEGFGDPDYENETLVLGPGRACRTCAGSTSGGAYRRSSSTASAERRDQVSGRSSNKVGTPASSAFVSRALSIATRSAGAPCLTSACCTASARSCASCCSA